MHGYWNDWYFGWGWLPWMGFIFLLFSSIGNWGYTYRAHCGFGSAPRGEALSVCGDQIAGSVPEGMTASGTAIGYEPLWAIGSGHMPTPEEIIEVHAHIRACLAARLGTEGKKVRILYGGSAKPSNARAILALPEVGGVLVGGASLKAADFEAIFRAVPVMA